PSKPTCHVSNPYCRTILRSATSSTNPRTSRAPSGGLLIKDTKTRKESPGSFANQLQKLRQRFQEIRDLDYFESSRGEDLQRLFQKAESLGPPRKRPETKERLRTEDYRGKVWITRPRPEIDRVGSAW